MSKKVGPLSHSSAKTLLGCEQKYVHYKVKGTKPDSDYEKSDALAVGSAFHWILEKSNHEKPESILDELAKCESDPDILLPPSQGPLVHAMVLKYLRLHKRMEFKVLQIEFQILTDFVTGFVDALMQDPDGRWWIVDLKTAANFYQANVPLLFLDPQLNLYAAHAEEIAERFDLDMAKFGGCRWRVTTKSRLKQKYDEDRMEYTKRLLKSVKCYDIEVPIEKMAPMDTLERHNKIFARSKQLYSPKAKPSKNFGNCMAFFKPCEYWSKCHGGLYSETDCDIVQEL